MGTLAHDISLYRDIIKRVNIWNMIYQKYFTNTWLIWVTSLCVINSSISKTNRLGSQHCNKYLIKLKIKQYPCKSMIQTIKGTIKTFKIPSFFIYDSIINTILAIYKMANIKKSDIFYKIRTLTERKNRKVLS